MWHRSAPATAGRPSLRVLARIAGILAVPALVVAGTLPTASPGSAVHFAEPEHGSASLRIVPGQRDGLVTVFADVAVDDEFMAQNGSGWSDALALALASANDLLQDIGVRVEMASLSTWESDDGQTNMSRILDGVLSATGRGKGRLVLALTCEDSVYYDGMSRRSQSAVAVRYAHGDWQRNGSLIAHEIGHILGAEHHPADYECESGGCVMAARGYAGGGNWCDEHRDAIATFLSANA